MFQHRIEAFFSEYLLSDAHPLGHITDYVIKIEFQMRGSPHPHWLAVGKGCPKIDKDPDDVVCTFIDKYITTGIPPIAPENEHHIKNWWKTLQKHTHSDYYHRNKSCHFGFPKPPTTKTLISRPPIDDNDEIIQNAKSVLQTVQNTLNNSRHMQYLYTTLPAKHQHGYCDIYRCIEDFKKRFKCHFAVKTHKMYL